MIRPGDYGAAVCPGCGAIFNLAEWAEACIFDKRGILELQLDCDCVGSMGQVCISADRMTLKWDVPLVRKRPALRLVQHE